MILTSQIDSLLDKVEKPSRYIGGELNETVKDWESVPVHYAFCFPDVYEVGMSHLGIKILYSIINSCQYALCERVFTPWPDMADLMRKYNVPMFSHESHRALRDFDLIGFTLQYELCYTNILETLDLAGIPLLSSDRGEDSPLIIAGGPCAFNPEPIASFVDVFSIGDGEESVLELLDEVKRWKHDGLTRNECLIRLSRHEGMYVPAFYEASYHKDGRLASFMSTRPDVPSRIRKSIVKDLDKASYPETFIVPYQEVIHDRIMLEIMRGCTRGCRFCQAGMLYRPVRERSVGRLLELAEKLESSTGYEEMSLSSLSTGDYSCLSELAAKLSARYSDNRVSLSLPSLRLDGKLTDSLDSTQSVRKSSLTFAPEAGTQRLRDTINKGITQQDIVRTGKDAFSSGWSSIKLYFMIGLPFETMSDVEGIVDTVKVLLDQYYSMPKNERPRGLHISVSTSSFVPKPFTPFQWTAQDEQNILVEKQHLLRDKLKQLKPVSYHWHDSKVSFLEACFACGDRRLGKVILEAWKNGCRFDGWTEHFKFDTWLHAFETCGMDPAFYANRKREEDELLPWDFIDAGVSRAYLWKEYTKAEAAQTTPDCRVKCNGCGLQEICRTCV